MEKRTNCPNCGAALDEVGDCPFCGTITEKKSKFEIEMTAEHIKFTCTEVRINDTI